MTFETIKLPSFPNKTVFISFFSYINKPVLENVKEKLIQADTNYDFCFLNTNYIVSREHLFSGVHRAIANYASGNQKANTLNTEIIFSMSPINNIMDSLKRFGVDTSREQAHLICIRVVDDGDNVDFAGLNQHLIDILQCDHTQNIELSDGFLFKTVDIPKLKKVYKLNDATIIDSQSDLTRLAIGACVLRGM